MKIKIEVEIDTITDAAELEELLRLASALNEKRNESTGDDDDN